MLYYSPIEVSRLFVIAEREERAESVDVTT